MFKFKVAALFDGTMPDMETHDVYVVKDKAVIFYVGMTRARIKARMYEHLGWSNYRSTLGKLIYANLPESRDWVVELFTKEECGCRTPKRAETGLIKALTPHLNVRENGDAPPLPSQYKPPHLVDYQNSPSDLIVITK